ncbi:PRC-barrel domain-containing protein [Oscillochloris sp. ZM17-4]|uniref:PRC-barrel domain-containing protein n=1 Tax=Oscillochloris sp. ZM17-4 TaxID=2866714 RepID=UPI001C737589|nr:PRC-barrel domain-containing protein [Oscillochloris sp. ZM17-4]
MDIRIDTNVECTDGPGGQVTSIILNPVTRRITDMVVREPGLVGNQVLVPTTMITEQTSDTLRLSVTRGALADLPSFMMTQYHQPGDRLLDTTPWITYPPGGIYLSPYMPIAVDHYVDTYENIPASELAMRRGDVVAATDGRVGRIEGFVVDPQGEQISHLLLREGHLWGTKDVSIPVASIKDIQAGVVHLKLRKDEVAALPTITVH